MSGSFAQMYEKLKEYLQSNPTNCLVERKRAGGGKWAD